MLENIYYNPEHTAGFSSLRKLEEAVPTYGKNQIQDWLQSQESYTLHKPIRKIFPRNKYHVTNINDLFEIDLIDVQSLSKFNNDIKYLLSVIDVFSKYAWVKPLKSKTAIEVSSAIEALLCTSGRRPLAIQSDKGKEFLGSAVQKIFKKYGIKHILANNPDIKASVIERFNRTLKTKMFKFFTFTSTYKYLDVLQKFIDAYNKTKHRTIKMAPADVTDENILQVYNSTYRNTHKNKKKNKFCVGDFVRISKYKHTFEKGYETNWTLEVFKIIKVIKRSPYTVYKICDLQNEPIDSIFYEPELQKVTYSDDSLFKIDKILKRRVRAGRRELYVRWKGYPEKFNKWIPETDVS